MATALILLYSWHLTWALDQLLLTVLETGTNGKDFKQAKECLFVTQRSN